MPVSAWRRRVLPAAMVREAQRAALGVWRSDRSQCSHTWPPGCVLTLNCVKTGPAASWPVGWAGCCIEDGQAHGDLLSTEAGAPWMTCPPSQVPSGQERTDSRPLVLVQYPCLSEAQVQVVILEGAPEKQSRNWAGTSASLNVGTLGEQGCLWWPFAQTPGPCGSQVSMSAIAHPPRGVRPMSKWKPGREGSLWGLCSLPLQKGHSFFLKLSC